MKQHIIYIPGLGDKNDAFRQFALMLWRRPNIAVTHVPMQWQNHDESFEQKMTRLEQAIARYPDRQTTLVGESAGGSVAITALKRFSDRVDWTVTICGMNQGAASVNPRYFSQNPAFKDSMLAVDDTLTKLTHEDRARIFTIYSSGDLTVRPHHTKLKDVRALDIKLPGHLLSIAAVLLVRYRLVTSVAKNLKN